MTSLSALNAASSNVRKGGNEKALPCHKPLKAGGKYPFSQTKCALVKPKIPFGHFVKPQGIFPTDKGKSTNPTKPYSLNPTYQMSENVERLYTRIFSKETPREDLAKRKQYQTVRLIQSGTEGEVFEGRDKNDQPVAMKFTFSSPPPLPIKPSLMTKKEDEKESGSSSSKTPSREPKFNVKRCEDEKFKKAQKECVLLKTVQKARHTVKLIDSFESSPYQMCVVLELLPTDLFGIEESSQFSLNQMAFIAKQILEALADYNELEVIHSDLKPENILSDPALQIKMTDFGLSCTPSTRDNLLFTGTEIFAAPERILGADCSSSVDVWSLGVLLVNCYSGTTLVTRLDFVDESCFEVRNDHLHTIVDLIGLPPKKLLRQGKVVLEYFDESEGEYFLKYKPSPFAFFPSKSQIGLSFPKQDYITKIVIDTQEKRGESLRDALAFNAFVKRMIAYERPGAEELLKDPFLAIAAQKDKSEKKKS